MAIHSSVTGLFREEAEALGAAAELHRAGFTRDQVSIVPKTPAALIVSAGGRYSEVENILQRCGAIRRLTSIEDGHIADQTGWLPPEIAMLAPEADRLEQQSSAIPELVAPDLVATANVAAPEADRLEQLLPAIPKASSAEIELERHLTPVTPEADQLEQIIPAYVAPEEDE